jgi:hypothetical protein
MTWPEVAVIGPEAVKLLTRGPAVAVEADDVPAVVVVLPVEPDVPVLVLPVVVVPVVVVPDGAVAVVVPDVEDVLLVVGVVVAGGVAEAVVSLVVEPETQHVFRTPTAGSPKTLLLQAVPPLSVRVTFCVVVPYLTLRVPLNEQVPPSVAHCDHDAVVLLLLVVVEVWVVELGLRLIFPSLRASASSVGTVVSGNALAVASVTSDVPLPPPQAASIVAASRDRP